MLKHHVMAIIGFGGMGGWHAENVALRLEGVVDVKGIYDVREEACEKAREKGLHVYASAQEILDDESVDLVTVATPNNFHKEYVIRCLKAGKNVVCEKPVAMNATELTEMIAAARESGKIFSVHQNRRWDKDYVIVKNLIDSGDIGTPTFIESRVQGSRRAMYGWRGHKVNGGGMVLDWGVHLIDQIMDLIDSPVVSVDAHLMSLYSDEVDDNIKIFLRFENGVSAICEMTTNCLINQSRWHVSCSDGTAMIEDWSCKGRVVKLNTDAQMAWSDDIVYTEAGPTRTMAPRPAHTTQELPLPEVTTEWTDYYKNITAAIDGVEALIVKPEQALRVMRVVDTVFEASRIGHGVNCYI